MLTREDLKTMIEVESLLHSLLPSIEEDDSKENQDRLDLWTKYWNVVERVNNYQWAIYDTIKNDVEGANDND